MELYSLYIGTHYSTGSAEIVDYIPQIRIYLDVDANLVPITETDSGFTKYSDNFGADLL